MIEEPGAMKGKYAQHCQHGQPIIVIAPYLLAEF